MFLAKYRKTLKLEKHWSKGQFLDFELTFFFYSQDEGEADLIESDLKL